MQPRRYTIKAFLFILFLFSTVVFGSRLFGQEWQKPDEKYENAYKEYLDAACPIEENNIEHFVYFARDRQSLKDHPLLSHPMFKGAQIMYTWKELEPQKDRYDFSSIMEDYLYLEKHNKKLFIQLQDATFNLKYIAIPSYLLTDTYGGGATIQYNDDYEGEGWVAKRWNKQVRERFALLLEALGATLDGKIEGINLQETAIGVNTETDSSFLEEAYLSGLKANMVALKKAFPTSTTMIYANFMPGEWLPYDDKGYLRSIYEYGETIGVGLGAPDLMVTRKGQLNHALALMHEGDYTVPVGIAVQDGNYIGKTGADKDYDETHEKGKGSRSNIVPLLHAFAKDFLKVRYMFWTNQEPYFREDVLPCFSSGD